MKKSVLNLLILINLCCVILSGCADKDKSDSNTNYVVISSAKYPKVSSVDYQDPKSAATQLQTNVNVKLSEGYHLIGGITVISHPGAELGGVMMFQAMAR